MSMFVGFIVRTGLLTRRGRFSVMILLHKFNDLVLIVYGDRKLRRRE